MPVIFSKKKLGKNRLDGFYETPIETVRYMSDKILNHYKKGLKICDPCVGDGVFLNYLLQNGVQKDDLHGYDIDKEKVKNLKKKFKNINLQDSTSKLNDEYDFIIGNPPYAGDESYFIRENRERLKKDYKRIKVKNLFSIISYNSIKHLKEGGYFINILSDAFLTNIYYKDFREFLLEEMEILEIVLTPRNLFRHIKADVGTCIFFAKKRKNAEYVFNGWNDNLLNNNKIKLIDRLQNQKEFYKCKNKTEIVKQSEIYRYSNCQFIIGVSKNLRDIYLNCKLRLGDIAKGGTGISTGNDKIFLKKEDQIKDKKNWVPYYKNSSRKKYFHNPIYFIEKKYQDYVKKYDNYLIRNEKYFFKEGISCASVGFRFSASYMPQNCLFGVNANFFFEDRDDLFYCLALLNTKLCWFFSRKILIRTNNISSNYLKLMPLIFPKNIKLKKEIILKTKNIVKKLIKNINYDINKVQNEIDKEFYDIYEIDDLNRKKIEDFTENFYDQM